MIKNDVIEYMAENWAEWKRTKPSWFTPGFISKIPDEFIPKRALRALNHASVGGVREKRNSMNLREFVRNSLGVGEEVADAAAGAISAEEREEGQRKLSMALRAGPSNRDQQDTRRVYPAAELGRVERNGNFEGEDGEGEASTNNTLPNMRRPIR